LPNSLSAAVGALEKLIGLSQAERRMMGLAAKEAIAGDHDSRRYAAAYSSLIKRLAKLP
jgi:hypothetical protein